MPSGKRFRLRQPLTFFWHGLEIRVDSGFVTDLASIPTTIFLLVSAALVLAGRYTGIDWLLLAGVALVLVSALLPKLGRQNEAAVIHDAIYQRKYSAVNTEDDVHIYGIPRGVADRIFFDGMAVMNVKPWKRRLMYWAVRLGGWASWRKR